ncbi:MAG: hypothetical protein N2483_10330, partial [Burkholderiaceae bacterium]|nr:hypothetical protein [Burkholderiaceae bacterium]
MLFRDPRAAEGGTPAGIWCWSLGRTSAGLCASGQSIPSAHTVPLQPVARHGACRGKRANLPLA